MIDIDYFKEINDCYGHIRGDEVLILISEAVKNVVNAFDGRVCRYGGDEFCVLISGLQESELERLSQQVKTAITDMQIENKKSNTDGLLTISIGYSTALPSSQDTLWGIIKKADEALYVEKSKRLSRRKDDSI